MFGHKKFSDPETKAAYEKAYREERLALADRKGREDAQNQQPLYKKIAGFGAALGKDIMNTDWTPKNDPFGVFPKKRATPKRRRKTKR